MTDRVHAKRDLRGGYVVFLIFTGMALLLNIVVYHAFNLGGTDAVFDMFYISPYYISSVAVFSILDSVLPYPVFMLLYLAAFLVGGVLIALMQKGIEKARQKQRMLSRA